MSKFITNLLRISLSIFIISLVINLIIYSFIDPTLKTAGNIFITKYRHFKYTKTDYDTIFFGSSRVYQHIDPVLYDSLMGTKSFNFGLPGCMPPSCTRLLEKISELPKIQKLKTLVLEFQTTSPAYEQINSEEIYYNSNLVLDLEALLFHWDKLDMGKIMQALNTAFYKYSRGIRLLFYKDKTYRNRTIEGNLGYRPLVEDTGESKEDKEKFYRKKKEKFSKLHLRSYKLKKDIVNQGNDKITLYQDYLSSILNKYKSYGVNVILVVSPLSTNVNTIYKQHSIFLKNSNFKILNFNSGKEHPEIYQLDNYYDHAHLNQRGAEVYTRVLANEINKGLFN